MNKNIYIFDILCIPQNSCRERVANVTFKNLEYSSLYLFRLIFIA